MHSRAKSGIGRSERDAVMPVVTALELIWVSGPEPQEQHNNEQHQEASYSLIG
jgi:hypothetical protein